jgi:anaerobic selenocysteine-containing dehydrogenase
VLDQLLRFGPYGGKLVGDGLSLAKLRQHPHGIDLGPLRPCLPERLHTADKRIALVPELFVGDMPRLAAELRARSADGALMLIGRRQLRTNNSWIHNSLRMAKGRDRCTLLMHPDDAATRGLEHGSRVRIRSRCGDITAPLHVSDTMMPGVVSLPHGFGHDREGVQLAVAKEHAPGVSANDVTDERAIDELTGTAALNGLTVTVEAVASVATADASAAQ